MRLRTNSTRADGRGRRTIRQQREIGQIGSEKITSKSNQDNNALYPKEASQRI